MAIRLEPKVICGVLRQVGVGDTDRRVWLTAISLAESGGEVDRTSGTRRGLWMIDDSRGFDQRKMVADAAYAATSAVEISRGGVYNDVWPSWTDGSWRNFLNVARQADAQQSAVSGTILDDDGSYQPGGSENSASKALMSGKAAFTLPGPGRPLAAAFEQEGPLWGLRVTGTELTADVASIVIGAPTYSAGINEIPNLTFTIADPQGDLLWYQRNLWVRGAKVQYMDLDMRIDEIKFEPGAHTTGQITVTAIDALVYSLQALRGTRVQKNVSPSGFVWNEVRLAGIDPNKYFLGEQMPTMSEIARDVPGQEAGGSGGETPSAWTTIQRLAKETGKRAFISGKKLIFGSTAFAADWSSTGDLRLGWHGAAREEQWQTLPTATQTSTGSGNGGTDVNGLVPLVRARHFRPGAPVVVFRTPSVAAGDRRMVCAAVSFTLSRDVDGAEITLMDPIELTPEKK